jgi:hypothetical protein
MSNIQPWFYNYRHGMIRAKFDHQNIRYYRHSRQNLYRTTDLPHQGRHQQNHLGGQSNHWLGQNNHPYRYPGIKPVKSRNPT